MARDAWRSTWNDALGSGWQYLLVFFALCLFAAGATFPLADPDLAIHLATGEWVVKHRAFPFVEPWAWTRAGAPFQAYSWAVETTYYLVLSRFGAIGLHALQGCVYLALGASILVLGRVARWSAWTTIVMAAVHLTVALGATPFLRPQAVLLIAMPLVWALVVRARDVEHLRWELPALTGVAAAVANAHLLFPITAAPCVLLLTRPPANRNRVILIPLAIVLGWFLTPYALHWIDIYKLNFAPNAMIGPPPIIDEYKPGFSMAATAGVSSLYVCFAFLALPWLVAGRYNGRERLLHGFLWFGGAALFALAVRALVVWWLVIIPTVAVVLEVLPPTTLPVVRLAQRAAVVVIFASVALLGVESVQDPWMRAGSIASRTLPSRNARSIEPIARWLDCNVRREIGGRLVTTFNFGGYVPWRLPYLSESIDGRTIFPDSVARAETYAPPYRRSTALQPWRTADLAIAPTGIALAAVLDTATGWRRIAITSEVEGRATLIGLWVTDRWWSRAGQRPLTAGLLPLPQRPGAEPLECNAVGEPLRTRDG